MANVRFDIAASNLSVSIETPRLHMQSLTLDNLNDYQALLGSKENMEHYATGIPWDHERIESRVKAWSARWQQGNPFSSFVVRLKSSNEVIGHIILTPDNKLGTAELAYVLHKQFWGQGYGKELLTHFVNDYIPELIHRRYQVNGHEFTQLLATSIPENAASIKLLQLIGMEKTGEEFSYGHNKLIFFAPCQKFVKCADEKHLNTLSCGLK